MALINYITVQYLTAESSIIVHWIGIEKTVTSNV